VLFASLLVRPFLRSPQNQHSRLPEAIRKSVAIDVVNLPYNQTEFISPHLKYLHSSSDLFDVSSSDSFVVAFTDGTNWTEVTIQISILHVNKVPQIEMSGTQNLVVQEDSISVSQELGFVDYDSSVVSIILHESPSHGKLSYEDSSGNMFFLDTSDEFKRFSPYGEQIPTVQVRFVGSEDRSDEWKGC